MSPPGAGQRRGRQRAEPVRISAYRTPEAGRVIRKLKSGRRKHDS